MLLIGMSLPELFQLIGTIIQIIDGGGLSASNLWWLALVFRTIGFLVQSAFGLYLLLGGRLIVDWCIPSNRPYCSECGYDLSNSMSDRCAECGIDLTHLFGDRIKSHRTAMPFQSEDPSDQQQRDESKQGRDQPLQ